MIMAQKRLGEIQKGEDHGMSATIKKGSREEQR